MKTAPRKSLSLGSIYIVLIDNYSSDIGGFTHRDEDDDFLIELAVASNSKVIITDNTKDIISGELKFDFEVLTPYEFLERNK